MGLFDKAKTFLGGHGVKVEILRLEKQEPDSVTFPLTDTVFKGNYCVSSSKDCQILAHLHEFILEKKQKDGPEERVVLDSDRHDESSTIHGSKLSWPYELAAGESVKDSFIMTKVRIPDALKKLGYSNPEEAVSSPDLRFYIKVTADVKGSPFDAEHEVDVKIVV